MRDVAIPSPQTSTPHSTWPPTFSDTFVRQARRLLDHSPVLIIVGRPGSSRHVLASAICDVGRGPVRTRHLARHGEQDKPYLAVRQVIRDLVAMDGDAVEVVEERIRTLLRSQGQHVPTVILLEADRCDAPSLAVLRRLAGDGVLRVIATTRPDSPLPHPAFAVGAERVDLLPLDSDTVRDLLRVRFRLDPHPSVVEMLRDKSGGTYGILREIADAAVRSGTIVDVEGVLMLDEVRASDTIERVDQTLAPHPTVRAGSRPEVTDLLQVAALVGELDLGEAEQCFAPAVLAEMLRHPSIRRHDDIVRIASSAEARLIVATMSLERKKALFTTCAPCFSASFVRPRSAMRSADWFIAVARPLPVELAQEAARQANLRGHHRRAVAFTDTTRSETGVVVAPLERALALSELGERRALLELFVTLDPAELSAEELLLYTKWGAQVAPEDVYGQLPGSAMPVGADDETIRARSAAITLGGLFAKAFDGSDATLERRVRTLAFSPILSDIIRAEAYTTLSLVQRHAGHPAAALASSTAALDLLEAVPGGVSAAHLDTAREHHILALIGSLDFDGARESLRVYGAASARHGGMPRLGHSLWGMLGLFTGDTESALFHATMCVETASVHDPHHVRSCAEAVLVQILVHQDRRDEAVAILARSAGTEPVDRLQHDLERRIARACAHDSIGEPEEALDILDRVMVEARKHHLRLAEIDAAILTVQVGGPDYLPELREAVAGVDELSGTCAVWRRFAAACSEWDFTMLETLAAELDAHGARMMSAQVAQYALDVARRADDLDAEARERLELLVDPPPRGTAHP